jgi:hypothetical protein
VLRVKRHEAPVLALVEMNQDRHEFAVTELTCSVSMRLSIAEALCFPTRLGLLAEIIDMAVQFQ